jgi:hypothetical protein
MSSQYSQNLKLELIGDGEQSGIWGDTTNYNLGTLLEQAITGVQPITVGGSDVTLTNFSGLSNQARNAVLYVTGSPGAVRIIYTPANQSKTYIIYNGVDNGYSLEVRVTGQSSGVTIPNGTTILMYTNGTQCFLVSPSTAPTPTVGVFNGYVTGFQLNVTSGTVLKDQVIYNPEFITIGNPNGYATVSAGTSNPYTLTYSGTSVNIGDAVYRPNQPFVAVTTPTQLATLDYIQNKTQSVYLGGTPTAPTASASVFEGYIPTGTSILVVTSVYPGSPGVSVGQFINGTNVTFGSVIQANGTGSAAASTFSGYISSGAGSSTPGTTLTITGISSGTPTLGQYIDGGATTLGTTLASGSGLSWGVSGAAQSVGSPTSPVVFRGLGAGSGSTGWYTLSTASTNAAITPIVAFTQQAQLVNMSLLSNISFLVGSLGTQDYNTVNITGGTINGVTITGSNIAVNSGGTGQTSLTPNSVLTAGSTSTGSVVQVRPETNGNLLTSTAGATVNASALVEGVQYTILTVGGTPTNWESIGAAAATVGTVFVKNSTAATGNGTATTNVWTSATPATSITPTSGTAPYYGARAFAMFSTLLYSNIAATYSQSGTTVTLTVASHAYQAGHYIYVDMTSGTGVDGLYVVTSVTPTTIVYTAGTSLTTSGSATIQQCSLWNTGGNIANVVYQTTGVFIINFTTPMPYANYTAMGSAGSNNGAAFSNADDNMISFGQSGYTGIRTTQSIRGFSTNSAGTGLENGSLTSVTIFA